MKSDGKKKSPTFWQTIVINIFNTLLIGIVLALITSSLNNKIEDSKNRNAFISEFNKLKAQKIGETWEALNVYEAKTDMILQLKRELSNNMGKNPNNDERNYKKMTSLLDEVMNDSVYYVTQKNRFWIDKEQYELMGDFVELIYRKQEIYKHFTNDSLRIIDNLINQKRGQIDSVIYKMLK